MTPLYALRDIEYRNGTGFTLQVDQLHLHPGRIYALAGPNGSGKSTLLRLLALLARPQRGQISFGGAPLSFEATELQRHRRRVTLVEQTPYLFDRSVAHNLAFGLRLRGVRGEQLRRRCSLALDQVGLAGFEQRRARQLSGGEIQRVALARALALEPEVLLLDEPTANLDRQTILALERLIADLPSRGITVIMATHDPVQPKRLNGELVRLVGGRLADPPHPPENRPQTSPEISTCPRPLNKRER
ncbi:tungstate ABC transporter ATP-binding protein [Desulfuromonas versatilis]|uniref:Tungstate ABC transporter ATP-binding protein n=1 Tax=Desulfuromonas versatilis TaxID=2802975 RepID=A0ABM8HRU2_9BACT|nr:ABC transporter ATP-binding protein [Desulfuromonas versatilis]BCR03293.1 tungstate ABC transporter ATP-binding protein [Desulfuromonas versatilis]